MGFGFDGLRVSDLRRHVGSGEVMMPESLATSARPSRTGPAQGQPGDRADGAAPPNHPDPGHLGGPTNTFTTPPGSDDLDRRWRLVPTAS